jgi:hypothetical protein
LFFSLDKIKDLLDFFVILKRSISMAFSTSSYPSLPPLTSSLTSFTSPTPLFSPNSSNNILPPIKDASTIQGSNIKPILPPINTLKFSGALNNNNNQSTVRPAAAKCLSSSSSSPKQKRTKRSLQQIRITKLLSEQGSNSTETNRNPTFADVSRLVNYSLQNLYFFKHGFKVSPRCRTACAIKRNEKDPNDLEKLEIFLKLAGYDPKIIRQSLQNDKNNKK